MKTIFRKRWYLFTPLILVAFAGFGYATMWLWNVLMPLIFHLPVITFWQTIGLLVLSRLLLGGFGGHGGRHHHCKNNMHEKWEKMTPEEREQFRQNMSMHKSSWFHKCSGEQKVSE